MCLCTVGCSSIVKHARADPPSSTKAAPRHTVPAKEASRQACRQTFPTARSEIASPICFVERPFGKCCSEISAMPNQQQFHKSIYQNAPAIWFRPTLISHETVFFIKTVNENFKKRLSFSDSLSSMSCLLNSLGPGCLGCLQAGNKHNLFSVYRSFFS
jgi:hypothetical protein